jgi:MoaA/NifB/PqqE/SkfB family radical SAM enzyme
MTGFGDKLFYYLRWYFRCVVGNERIPLNSSLILTDECNLQCKHCVVARLGYARRDFQNIQSDILTLYEQGSRMLVITGGEPFLWHDQDRTLEDVVRCAKEIGFFRVVICTNGMFPLVSSADYLWVSLDGTSEAHNELRGDHHAKVCQNIRASAHNRIYVNFTISRINARDFEQAAWRILQMKKIKGILFHLYTPYVGADPALALDAHLKRDVLWRLSRLKRRHPIKIFNTFAGLKALRTDQWQRPVWGSVTMNQGELSTCCCRKGIYDVGVCQNCGCTPAVETWVLQQAKWTAFLENLRYL